MTLVRELIQLYIFIIFARVVLSWFPMSPGSPFASIYSFVYSITEPVLGPVRRVLPSVGMLDLSPIVVFFALELLASALH